MKLKLLFLLAFSLTLLNVQSSEVKVPQKGLNKKEIEAFKKELKYIKNLKNQYLKKGKILNHLTLESKSLLKAKKSFLKKKYHYQRNIKKFQNLKRNRIIKKEGNQIRKPTKYNDFIASQYVSRVRKLLSKKRIALHCKNKESKKSPFTSYEGITSTLLTIDSDGHLLKLKFISPIENGVHNQSILNCLAQEITHVELPSPPINKTFTILQPFYFSS